jgi:hypothetical protein
MQNRLTYISLLAGAALVAASCSKSAPEGWSIEGTVPAGTQCVLIEGAGSNAYWSLIDSVNPETNGSFKYQSPTRAAVGTMLRLRTSGGQMLYFPVDSTESLTVSVSADGSHRLQGSQQALYFSAIDSCLHSSYRPGLSAQADSLLKRSLLSIIEGNYGTTAGYYMLRKTIDGVPLFNPVASRMDFSALRAVANGFNTQLPDDPRSKLLRDELASVQSARNSARGIAPTTGVVYLPEVSYFEVELPDASGRQRKLSDAIAAHSVVVLNFANIDNEATPALNMILGELYGQLHASGLEIFQVGFSDNQNAWQQATARLPWISVFQAPAASTTHLSQYMVNELPATFIIRNGEIVKRITDYSTLKDDVRSQF